MTYDKALRSLDRLITDNGGHYTIERASQGSDQLYFTVVLHTRKGVCQSRDPMLTRAIWDVLNIASTRTI